MRKFFISPQSANFRDRVRKVKKREKNLNSWSANFYRKKPKPQRRKYNSLSVTSFFSLQTE